MDIRNAIRLMAQKGTEMYNKICVVDSVDEDMRTIECTPIDEGAPLLGVNLQANQEQEDGVVSFPAVGSYVLVGFISPSVATVLMMSEVTKILVKIGDTEMSFEDGTGKIKVKDSTVEFDGKNTVFNGGSEVMANAQELQKQLNTMSARIDAIINAISSAPVAPMDGGATFKTSLVGTLAPHLANKENFSQILDDKIKH